MDFEFLSALWFHQWNCKRNFFEEIASKRWLLEDNGMCNFCSKSELFLLTRYSGLFIFGLFESG